LLDSIKDSDSNFECEMKILKKKVWLVILCTKLVGFFKTI